MISEGFSSLLFRKNYSPLHFKELKVSLVCYEYSLWPVKKIIITSKKGDLMTFDIFKVKLSIWLKNTFFKNSFTLFVFPSKCYIHPFENPL